MKIEKSKNKKTPISYYGGKQMMLPRILPIIPQHKIYVEAFFGGGAVFWSKEESEVEVINDLNGQVINFYRQLKSNSRELKERVESTPYSRESYKQAMVVYNAPYLFNEVTRAWSFWVATVQGFSNKIGSWRCAQNTNKECKLLENKKLLISDETSQRLKHVQIESKDAIKLILKHDTPDTFFYLDPPYVDSNQGHYGGYMQSHFDELLDTLRTIKGKFLLSSYPNAKLKELTDLEGWSSIGNDLPLSASATAGRRKVEMLTFNYDLNED
ncbi:DNA adenine methylase [Brumimicrobium mesophilum]|uniref:DNA adenine methylase n=1 Tax=Brumimicrobium mesophilum TaxID=392717 RepID=UPI000D141C07|nr:DNA adenine methylase [Brumimicrobium mesophilum]